MSSEKTPLRELNLTELAKETSLPPRTIRFYISRGLVPGPRKAGRAASYGEEHLERIQEIRAWQADGLTLAEIEPKLLGEPSGDVLPQPSAWQCYQLDADVTVNVRAGVAPWKQKRIQRLLGELAHHLSQTNPKEKEEDNEQ